MNDWEDADLPDEMDEDACFDTMEAYDACDECGGYGDDYFINDEGELECYCPKCPFYPPNRND